MTTTPTLLSQLLTAHNERIVAAGATYFAAVEREAAGQPPAITRAELEDALQKLGLNARRFADDVGLLRAYAQLRQSSDRRAPLAAIADALAQLNAAGAQHEAALAAVDAAKRAMDEAGSVHARARMAMEDAIAAGRQADELAVDLVRRGFPGFAELRAQARADAEQQRATYERAQRQAVDDETLRRQAEARFGAKMLTSLADQPLDPAMGAL
ncbi:MAG: hypothetical protein IT455_20675 [Planctomycetes bacterium]|nr:hypothetical protein [Planctomycetota bacterium]